MKKFEIIPRSAANEERKLYFRSEHHAICNCRLQYP